MINYSYYNFGLGDYYSSQTLNLFDVRLIRNLPDLKAKLTGGLNYSRGRGSAGYDQINFALGGQWNIRPELLLSTEFEFRTKSTDEEDFNNTFFFAKLIYNF